MEIYNTKKKGNRICRIAGLTHKPEYSGLTISDDNNSSFNHQNLISIDLIQVGKFNYLGKIRKSFGKNPQEFGIKGVKPDGMIFQGKL